MSALFQSGKIGGLSIKNRVFIPAHATGLFDKHGRATQQAFDYYAKRIRGGAGMVFLGETLVAMDGVTWGIPVSQDANIEFTEKLSSLGRDFGCAVLDQLSAQGGQVWWEPGVVASGPSAVPHPISGVRPDELSAMQIRHMRNLFVSAAKRAKRAGLAGCEVKADQGKLIHQFLSRRYNRRTDEYGGNPSKRLLFLKEVLSGIKDACGGFPLGLRIASKTGYAESDLFPDLSAAEVEEIVYALHTLSLLDFLNITTSTNSWPRGYWNGHSDLLINTRESDHAVIQLKSISPIPTLFAGQFRDLGEAEQLLSTRVCDYVGFARAHIADPEFTQKVHLNELDDIRPCIQCNQGCVGNTWEGRGISCTTNPDTGREGRARSIQRPTRKQRILVIGAGPAGLEFATESASLGYEVVLADANEAIGGRLLLASKIVRSVDWNRLLAFYDKRISRLKNLELRLLTTVDSKFPGFAEFHHVVFAGGRRHQIPEEMQSNLGLQVFTSVTAFQNLAAFANSKVVVVDENPYEGTLNIAAQLAPLADSVAIITTQEFVGKGLDQVTLTSVTAALRTNRVTCHPLCELARVDEASVHIRCLCTGHLRKEACSKLILGIPPLASTVPKALFEGQTIHLIGDSVFPRGIEYALNDARELLFKLNSTSTSHET